MSLTPGGNPFLCWVFPNNLKKDALVWFLQLRPNNVSLSTEFAMNYSLLVAEPKTTDHLFEVIGKPHATSQDLKSSFEQSPTQNLIWRWLISSAACWQCLDLSGTTLCSLTALWTPSRLTQMLRSWSSTMFRVRRVESYVLLLSIHCRSLKEGKLAFHMLKRWRIHDDDKN